MDLDRLADNAHPSRALGPLAPSGPVALALQWAVQAGLVILAAAGGAVLTGTDALGWTILTVGALGVWVGWLYWRSALGEVGVPAHPLQPFLAAAALMLLVHLLAGGHLDAGASRMTLPPEGMGVLSRLMLLGLMILLFQDVLSRLHALRWLLTGGGGGRG